MAYITDAAKEYAKKHACDENLTDEHKILLKKLQSLLDEASKLLSEANDIHDKLIDDFKDDDTANIYAALDNTDHAYHRVNDARHALEKVKLD